VSITLVPRPKSVTFASLEPVEIGTGSTAILIGEKASEPEQYAAEFLQITVERRYAQKWPVIREGDDLARFSLLIVLGQPGTCSFVQTLAGKLDIDLVENEPGRDAYSIRMGEVDGRFIALVGGTNARAVIYGQDTLFQLLKTRDNKLFLHRADIDDWASIPWRGRPHASNPGHFVPGRFDSYARARFNWTDLRDGPKSGQYGYPPGCELKIDDVNRVVRESGRRGMFVYATVDCAVRPRDFDAAIRTFEELIALGADGLYISIDDPGAEFRFGTPDELIERVLELGRKHGMTGRKMAIVPGKVSYSSVLTDVNRRVAKIPGMDDALWFFTIAPSAQELADAKSIGLKIKPCWWHNWPRPEHGGLTYGYYGGSIRTGGKHCYMEPPTLALGWGEASFGDLEHAAEHIEAVMPWGGGEWGAEYNSSILGWWAWAPELYDWHAVRGRIYDIVFGPDQVDAAFDFDDSLAKLRGFFTRDDVNSARGHLPVLADPSKRQDVRDLVAKMRKTLEETKDRARSQSLAPPDVLEDYYLEPMAAVLDIAATIADLDFPEYWWDMHEERIRIAAREGTCEQVAQWVESARRRVERETGRVRDVLKDRLMGTDDYAARWNSRFEAISIVPVAAAAPRITGDLSDPVWKQGLKITQFTFGRHTPPDPTEAYVLATDTDLFVAFLCHEQRMGSLKLKHAGRDSEVWLDDSVEIFLNPDMLGDAVYQIVVNAAGHFRDARGGSGKPGSAEWNGDIEAKTSQAADRWIAEVRIPLKDLGIEGGSSGQMWRMNLARNDFAGPFSGLETDNACEVSSWTGQGDFHNASLMKPVVFGD
jgi:hypothetical protein